MEDDNMRPKQLSDTTVRVCILGIKTKGKLNEKKLEKRSAPSTVNGTLIKRKSCEPRTIRFD